MNLYGERSKSIPQKIIIHLLEIFCLWLSYLILFKQGGDFIHSKPVIYNVTNTVARREIIFVFNVVTFLRLAFMMFCLLKRKIPWEESVSVPFAFALYYIGYSLLVLPTRLHIDWIDYAAILLFVTGCVLNTCGEIMRGRWKKHPENRGKIYTQGFFKYSMHINYFGDLLWVTAYAIITRNVYSISIPVFLLCFFVFYNVPMLDKHLRDKYGKDFEDYAKRTKKLIPFIY